MSSTSIIISIGSEKRPSKGVNRMQEELTVSHASRTLGIALDYVYRLIYSGKLTARKSEGRWLIPVSDVESRLKAREERNGSTQ